MQLIERALFVINFTSCEKSYMVLQCTVGPGIRTDKNITDHDNDAKTGYHFQEFPFENLPFKLLIHGAADKTVGIIVTPLRSVLGSSNPGGRALHGTRVICALTYRAGCPRGLCTRGINNEPILHTHTFISSLFLTPFWISQLPVLTGRDSFHHVRDIIKSQKVGDVEVQNVRSERPTISAYDYPDFASQNRIASEALINLGHNHVLDVVEIVDLPHHDGIARSGKLFCKS
ncbi:hypothetical protein BX666DRAFT_2112641 [Dichotomocladium elegans]|nr:hypothetical protein BX666DRAFT_2112641 [Dichotomocladium elegans]